MPRQGFHGLYIISIHTPTKGATNKTYIDSVTTIISIHTPTKGATLVNALRAGFKKFQSTLPRRERLSGVGKTTINDIISIHTPTKGATLDCNLSVSLNKFQSTLPQRERPKCVQEK